MKVGNERYEEDTIEGISHLEEDIEKYNDKELEPYLKALIFFAKIKFISKNFARNFKNNNTNPNLPNFKSIVEFINYFIENSIYNKNGKLNNNNQIELLKKNPQKVFIFFLDELHKIFKENKEEDENNQLVNAVEYDKQIANNLFENYMKNDKSYITENFYGKKKIKKYCNNCQLTQYLYKYIKVIPINLRNSKGQIDNIEDYLDSFEEKFNKNFFCQMCSSKQKLEINLEIVKRSKILIFIIINTHNEVELNIKNSILNDSYELICAVVNNKKSVRSLFDYIISLLNCYCKKKSKILYNKSEKIFKIERDDFLLEKNIKNSKPYVLFYKRIKEEEKEKDVSKDEHMNSGDNLISFNINNEKSYNNINNINDKNDIVLYFRLEINGKEVFIDTDDNKTFSTIVEEIKKKYDWSNSMIDENKLFCNKKKINPKKTPRQLGINNEERIIVST